MSEEQITIPSFIAQGEFEFGIVTEKGITLDDSIPENEWSKITEEACEYLEKTGRSHMQATFVVADLLRHGDKNFHENYGNVIDATREYMRIKTALIFRWMRIAGQINPERRRELLTLAHHEEVAPLKPELQDRYLQLAIDENMTVKELRGRIREEQPKKKKLKKKEDEPDPEEVADILAKMIETSNWCSKNLDKITKSMRGPLKKLAEVYRRKWEKKK